MNSYSKSRELAERLKKLRLARQLSIEDMSRAIGCAPSTYREWEHGRSIQGEPYVAIAQVLRVSLVELLTGTAPSPAAALYQIDVVKKAVDRIERELLSFE